MNGIVLWIDRAGHKAVIWCEDHKDMAIADDRTDAPEGFFEATERGDLVRISFVADGPFRQCTAIELLRKQVCSGLDQRLLGSVTAPRPQRRVAPTLRLICA